MMESVSVEMCASVIEVPPINDAVVAVKSPVISLCLMNDVRPMLVRDLASFLNAFVARRREEPVVDGADALRACQLSNHLIEYVAGIAATHDRARHRDQRSGL
jgi:hypothetical protein